MRIKKIISQCRRDFQADYECEHCGFVNKDKSGYDDAYFYQYVIPKMQCPRCKRAASDDYRPLTPKYPESQIM